MRDSLNIFSENYDLRFMMASTSKPAPRPVLPPGWSQHMSTRVPGQYYYFNRETGATTWDIREIVSGKFLQINSYLTYTSAIYTLQYSYIFKFCNDL